MSGRSRPPASEACEHRPDRAVIDIGSNTVRLVIYSGHQRAPISWLNEKVSARLGRDLSTSGRMPGKAMRQALAALARYTTILADLAIGDVQTVATAAVRDAENGPGFLEAVRKLGLAPRLLTGEEEAQAAAFGVIGAFPGALGTVADLGGGSLELVMVEHGGCHDGVSLPLGTLRLPMLRDLGPDAFRDAITIEMNKAKWATAHPGHLYMVGGTWRALAAFALRRSDHPLTDPHAITLSIDEADRVARQVAKLDPAELALVPGISAARAGGLPSAAMLLRVMLAELQPAGVVFSAWGLREGLLFQRLGHEQRRVDPLLAGIADFTSARGGGGVAGAAVAAWTAAATGSDAEDSERLRLAATMLALAAAHIEPNLRERHANDWAMDKRWVGLDPEGRARIAAALLASGGTLVPRPEHERLASEAQLREAIGWGLGVRVARRLAAGSAKTLAASSLRREGQKLVLEVAAGRAHLVNDKVSAELKALAGWQGLEPEMRTRDDSRSNRRNAV